jgi:hypothetical protein
MFQQKPLCAESCYEGQASRCSPDLSASRNEDWTSLLQGSAKWNVFIMRYKKYFVRFQVHTAVNIKTEVLWDVKACSLVDGYDRLGETCCHLETKRNIAKIDRGSNECIHSSGMEKFWKKVTWKN